MAGGNRAAHAWTRRRQPGSSACRVAGCGSALGAPPDAEGATSARLVSFSQSSGVCIAHLRSDAVPLDGGAYRYCQASARPTRGSGASSPAARCHTDCPLARRPTYAHRPFRAQKCSKLALLELFEVRTPLLARVQLARVTQR